MSSGKASLPELDSDLSLEDAYDLVEILTVDNHNRAVMRKALEQRGEG